MLDLLVLWLHLVALIVFFVVFRLLLVQELLKSESFSVDIASFLFLRYRLILWLNFVSNQRFIHHHVLVDFIKEVRVWLERRHATPGALCWFNVADLLVLLAFILLLLLFDPLDMLFLLFFLLVILTLLLFHLHSLHQHHLLERLRALHELRIQEGLLLHL